MPLKAGRNMTTFENPSVLNGWPQWVLGEDGCKGLVKATIVFVREILFLSGKN